MTRETTKRVLTIGTIVFVLVVIIGYSSIASHSLISGPSIVVSTIGGEDASTPTRGIIYGSFSTSTVTIIGVAKRIQSIYLNGSPIQIDEAGNFSQNITLFKGFNAEILSAKDTFGHTTQVQLDLNRE